jgi:hypothetical protein
MMTQAQDIREHSDGELSLLVMNDEYLYRLRRRKALLLATLNEMYIYTAAQLADLEQTLADDEAEENA